MSSISLFKSISAVYPDPNIFFGITASVGDVASVNPNSTKMLLANGVSTFFINDKPTEINGVKNFRNPPSWLVIFLVLPFYNIPPFPKDLITFIISFISLFLSIKAEPLIDESIFLLSYHEY